MPRAAKPPDRLQRQRPQHVVQLLPQTAEIPPPPPGIGKKWRDEWDTFWTSDLCGAVTPAHMPALRRLFEKRALLERLERAGAKQPVTGGSKGQERLNPLLVRAATVDKEISMLEDRFGLTPGSQLKIMGQLGQARASLEELARLDDQDRRADRPDPRLASEPGQSRV